MKRALLSCLALALLAALLIGGWTLYWRHSAAQLDAGFQAWTGAQRAEGYDIRYESATVAGYPTHLTLIVTNPVVVTPEGRRWEGPRIAGEAAVWDPFTLDIDYAGRHLLSFDRAIPPLYYEVEMAEAAARLTLDRHGYIERGRTQARDLVITGSDGRESRIDLIEVSAGPAQAPSDDDNEGGSAASGETLPRHDFSGRLLGLLLPEDTPEAKRYGREIDHAFVTGTLVGEIPAQPVELALPAWRDQGGHLLIEALEFRWGPIGLEGEGRVSLDPLNRPAGELTLDIAGLPVLVNDLEAAGEIEPAGAALLRLGVIALSQREDETGQPVATLPVTMAGGRLSLGPLPIAPLPPLF